MPEGKKNLGQGDSRQAVAALGPGEGGLTLCMGRPGRSQTY